MKRLLLLLCLLLSCSQKPAPMVLEYDTTLSKGTSIVVPLYGAVDAVIHWGDGSADTVGRARQERYAMQEGEVVHRYAKEGRYKVSIEGAVEKFGFHEHFSTISREDDFRDMQKLTRVRHFGALGLRSLEMAFKGAVNLQSVPEELPPTVTNLRYCFDGCTTLDDPALTQWDVRAVTDMGMLFRAAQQFNADLSRWDVSAVTDMAYMFAAAKQFRGDLRDWNVGAVTDMDGLFEHAYKFDADLSRWNVSAVREWEHFDSYAGSWQKQHKPRFATK